MTSRPLIQVLLFQFFVAESTAADSQMNKPLIEDLHINHTLKPVQEETDISGQTDQFQSNPVNDQMPTLETGVPEVLPQPATEPAPTPPMIIFSDDGSPTNGTSNPGVLKPSDSDGNTVRPSEPEGGVLEPSEPEGGVLESSEPEGGELGPLEPERDVLEPLEPEAGEIERFEPDVEAPESPNSDDNGFNPHGTWMNLTIPMCTPSFSCTDRCQGSGDNVRFDFKLDCRCDISCLHMGDCCQDFITLCLQVEDGRQTEDFLTQNGHLLLPPNPEPGRQMGDATYMYRSYGVCQSTHIRDRFGAERPEKFWTVSKCPSDYVDEPIEGTKEMCEGDSADPEFSFPVSHRWNGQLVFRNVYCALCHGVAMRDILFWKIVMHCHLDSSTVIRSYNDLRYAINQYPWCHQALRPIIPELAAPRPCKYVADTKRCAPEANGQILSQSALLMLTLCNLYVRPVDFERIEYANMHCAYCSGHVLPPNHFVACPFAFFIEATSALPLQASLDLWNGRLEVSANTTTILVSEDGRHQFVDSWKTYRKQRHENCWAASEDSRFELFHQCRTHLCPETVPLPDKDLSGTNHLCSIRKYRFSGNYGSHLSSRANGSLVNFKVEFPGDDVDKVSRVISDDVIKMHVGRENAHEFRLIEANALSRNRSSVVMLWSSEESYLSILQLASVLHHRLHREFSSPTSETTNVRTTVSSLQDPNNYCLSGDIISYRRVDLVTLGYHALVVVDDLPCYLELEKIGFYVTLSVDSPEGYPPHLVDRILLCQNSQIEQFCGKFPVKQAEGSATDLKPNNLNGDGPNTGNEQKAPGTIKKDEVGLSSPKIFAFDDSQDFKRICYALSACSQLLVILRCATSIFRTARSSQRRLRYQMHMITGIDFMVLMVLYFITPDVNSTGKVAMGAVSHLCWLCFASMMIVHLLDRLFVKHQGFLAKHSEEIPKDKAKIPTHVMKIILSINILIVITCLVIDVEDFHDLEIGYRHHSDQLLWVSNRSAFLIAFVIPWAVSLLAVCVMRIGLCVHVVQNSSQETARSQLVAKVTTTTKSGSMFELIFTSFFVLIIVEHFDDGHPVLLSLLFSLTSCAFSLWHLITVWGQGHTHAQTTRHEGRI